MPRVQFQDIDPTNISTTAYMAATTTGLSGTLLATSAGDSVAHLVTIKENDGANQAALTFTVTGTDADGVAQTETLTGPGASATVSTAGYYLTVSAVTWSATLGATTISVGFSAYSSKTFILDRRGTGAPAYSLNFTGTCTITPQISMSPNATSGLTPSNTFGRFWTTAATATTDTTATVTAVSNAIRFISNNYNDDHELQIYISATN